MELVFNILIYYITLWDKLILDTKRVKSSLTLHLLVQLEGKRCMQLIVNFIVLKVNLKIFDPD